MSSAVLDYPEVPLRCVAGRTGCVCAQTAHLRKMPDVGYIVWLRRVLSGYLEAQIYFVRHVTAAPAILRPLYEIQKQNSHEINADQYSDGSQNTFHVSKV